MTHRYSVLWLTLAAILFGHAHAEAQLTESPRMTFTLRYGPTLQWTDPMIVQFKTGATDDFDAEFDGRNLMGGALNNEIYTILNGTEFVINVLPFNRQPRSLAVGIRVGTAGNMTLSMSPESGDVTLEDRETNTTHSFANGAYTFSANTGKIDNRWILHFNTNVTSVQDDRLLNAFYAFAGVDGGITVALREPRMEAEVSATDVTGRIVAAAQPLNADQPAMLPVQAPGLYLVRVQTATGMAVRRVVVQ